MVGVRQYAHGFRSPPYGDVNVGFTNLQSGYTVIPNPDLKPETSNGFELGVRFVDAAFYAGLTGYYNDYKDFIESLVLVSAPTEMPMVFQSRNVSDARIHESSSRRASISARSATAWKALPCVERWLIRGATTRPAIRH